MDQPNDCDTTTKWRVWNHKLHGKTVYLEGHERYCHKISSKRKARLTTRQPESGQSVRYKDSSERDAEIETPVAAETPEKRREFWGPAKSNIKHRNQGPDQWNLSRILIAKKRVLQREREVLQWRRPAMDDPLKVRRVYGPFWQKKIPPGEQIRKVRQDGSQQGIIFLFKFD